jgi:hypothetical protein
MVSRRLTLNIIPIQALALPLLSLRQFRFRIGASRNNIDKTLSVSGGNA